MQRVKNIDYTADDLYSDDDSEQYADDDSAQQPHTTEDRENFTTLTPVVRAELEEAGLQASDREIEDALWHYYWDVGKSVAYLKNARPPRQGKEGGQKKEEKAKKEGKGKSRFDVAAEKSAEMAGQFSVLSTPGRDWVRNTSWFGPEHPTNAHLVPVEPIAPRPKLLGGSSKLAKLAEERRKRATAEPPKVATNGASSALDRLSRPSELKENVTPQSSAKLKTYPGRKKRDPTPPPREPTPPPEEPEEKLPDMRASPTDFARTLSTSPDPRLPIRGVALEDLLGSCTIEDSFQGPSPDDSVIRSTKTAKSSTPALTKKTQELKLDPAPSTPSQPKIKSKGLEVPKLWEEGQAERRPSIAFVVIGHVDHGKSTLMGRSLLDTGAVSQRDIDKYKKQATELGKASFALAWVMDTGSEERERGVTVDIAQHHFSTDKVDFTILDAPGHRDFVPNMIGGASMADVAVLVVDANQLDSGMKGQTKEHVLLAKACGIESIVVAVNKMDTTTPSWDQTSFERVKDVVSTFLTEAGFAQDQVSFVPCSGLSGENVVNPPPSDKTNSATAWLTTTSLPLLQTLETRAPPLPTKESLASALRLRISDVFRGTLTSPLSISGRIAQGTCQTGDALLLLPSNEHATIRAIEISSQPHDYAFAGQIATLHLSFPNAATDLEALTLRAGDLVTSPETPVAVRRSFTARVKALETLLPMGVDVHLGRLHFAGRIGALVAVLEGEKGEAVVRKKPRIVREGLWARVRMEVVEGALPVESGERVVLRAEGRSVAVGVVESRGK